MGLLITLILITFNVYGSISSTLAPPKRGFSFIEVWMTAIIFTISFAILEYCFILVLIRMNIYLDIKNKSACLEKITKIDFISLVISLIFLLLFIIFYLVKGLGLFWNTSMYYIPVMIDKLHELCDIHNIIIMFTHAMSLILQREGQWPHGHKLSLLGVLKLAIIFILSINSYLSNSYLLGLFMLNLVC